MLSKRSRHLSGEFDTARILNRNMMKEKDHIREELEGLSPLLAKMKEDKQQPFRVPAGYFQSLPDDVLRRIRAEEGLVREKAPEIRTAWRERLGKAFQAFLQPRYAIALASVVVLVAAGWYLFWPAGPAMAEPSATLASLSQEEITEYITNNIESFDIGLMVEAAMASEEDVRNIEVMPNIGDKELNEYLDEYIDEISLEDLEKLL